MKLVNCKQCGTLTTDLQEGYCKQCLPERERLMTIIRDFLFSNRGAGISDILNHTGIPSGKVIELLHEGRISVIKESK